MTARAARRWSPRRIAWLGALVIGLMVSLAGYDLWQGRGAQDVATAAGTLGLAVLAALLLALLARQLGQLQQAQDSLQASQERFAAAVAGSDDGIWEFDFHTQRVFNSARARALVGMPPGPETVPMDEWLETLPRYLHPEDVPRRQSAMDAHLAGRTPTYQVDVRHRHDDGRYRWVRIRGLCQRDAEGKPSRMAGSITDIDAQRRAEESLRASEERFALAVEGSNDGIVDWDVVNDVMYVSERAREILGIHSPDAVRTRAAWMSSLRLHPDDVAPMQESLEWVFAGEGDVRERELRVQSPGGEYHWVRIRGKRVRDASGRPMRWAGSVADIDARKRAEERLRESEERFALAVAGSNDGIVDWDVARNRMYASKRALEILGIDSSETLRSRDEWRALIQYHPDDQARMSRELEDFVEGRTAIRDGEYRVRQPDGSYRWIRHRNMAVRGADGRALRVAGSVSDIDARKRAEERFQLAVEGSNQGLWDWDLITDLNYISPRLQEIMGLEPGEPLRPRPEWLALAKVHPDDLERVRAAQLAHLRGQAGHLAIEYRIGTPAGEWRWVRQRGVALRDQRGKAYRIAGSTEDITAIKNAEAERVRLEGQLLQAKKLEAIGTLAGGIAHDFNNILSAILGYGEMAQKGAPEGSALRRHVDAVVGAGLRAKSLVERILAFSRSGVGARVAVDVEAVVGEALGHVAASLPANVRLDRRLDAAGASVLGDPTQIHQVVMNLCANAAQSMRAGGTLTVALDVADKAQSQAATSVLAAGRYVRLRVADTGSGIPDEVRDRIFDPFFTTKGVGVGTGLGLSLVHGIVTDLGGGIDVESHAGEGTAFTVYLPWSETLAERAAIEESPPEGRGETVLLVDDEEALVHLGEEMIASLGYEPVGFTSSAAALAEFRAAPERFQAVLSDETMPELTGSELAAEIRRLRPDIPILLMSGFVSPALAARARSLGVVQVLSKPLASREIARSLAAAIAAKS